MNKAVLVTGATGGIGEAVCRNFAENGYDIAIHFFKNEEKAVSMCKDLENRFGITARVFQANLCDFSQIEVLCEKVLSCFDIDVLVNNAGIAHQNLFQFVSKEKSDEIFSVNIQGAMALTQKILPSMIKKQSGRIINISSMWGVSGGSCEVHYSAAKAAMIGFTKALSKEVGPSGITVNCIAPGLIDTKMNSNLSKEDIASLVEETPLGRIGTGEDIANLAAFLASEKASFITGQTISVDGGLG